MSTAVLRQFMHKHPDFRYSRLSTVQLHDPWVLATQNASREHLLRNLLPIADSFREEGMWDLTATQPQLQTWRARCNLSVHSLVQTWIDGQGDDPSRGIAAQVCQPPITYVDHDAILSTNRHLGDGRGTACVDMAHAGPGQRRIYGGGRHTAAPFNQQR